MVEASTSFSCFGGRSSAYVTGEHAEDAVELIETSLRACHDRFSRFDPHSELSRLNADTRATVPVSPMLARLAQGAIAAAVLTGGLVDATLAPELEHAGYATDHRRSLPLEDALADAPSRRPARPRREGRWAAIAVDGRACTITRPPGVTLDTTPIDNASATTVVPASLAAGTPRTVAVTSPFVEDEILHELEVADGGVATSGIGRRSWFDHDGHPAHHVLDPSTGKSAYTGLVQVTALAPTALEAEARAKAALLSGPEGADRWLPHGGVIVSEQGRYEVLGEAEAPATAAYA